MDPRDAKAFLEAIRALTPLENRAWAEAVKCGDARRKLNEACAHLRSAERAVETAIKMQQARSD